MSGIKQLPFVSENVNYPVGGLDYISLGPTMFGNVLQGGLTMVLRTTPKEIRQYLDDNQDDLTNHKVFQSMKKYVSKSERIKAFVEYIESDGHRVEDFI